MNIIGLDTPPTGTTRRDLTREMLGHLIDNPGRDCFWNYCATREYHPGNLEGCKECPTQPPCENSITLLDYLKIVHQENPNFFEK